MTEIPDPELSDAFAAVKDAQEQYEFHNRMAGKAYNEHKMAGSRVAEILKERYGCTSVTVTQLSSRNTRLRED